MVDVPEDNKKFFLENWNKFPDEVKSILEKKGIAPSKKLTYDEAFKECDDIRKLYESMISQPDKHTPLELDLIKQLYKYSDFRRNMLMIFQEQKEADQRMKELFKK